MTDKNAPAGQQPIINIIGEKVALGPMSREHLPLYYRWRNDLEVMRFDARQPPSALEQEQERYDRAVKTSNASDFAIYEKSSLRPIGLAGLYNISNRNRNAEFGIMIGEKDRWGKGYGTEVTKLMLDYGFTCLGLHNIFLWVNDANERGIRAYRRAGFRMAGRLRQCSRLGGRAYDEILMDCLATEFKSGALRHLLPDSAGVEK